MLQHVINSLVLAYARGEIIRGNAKTCAVGTILRAQLGYADTKWWETMIAFASGNDTKEDRMYASYLKKETGFAISDLWRIDAAFEGAPYIPGTRRPVTDEDMVERLGRVVDVLRTMNPKPVMTE